MIAVALLAYAAFAASVLTTSLSLVRLLWRISRRAHQLASLIPTKIVHGSAQVEITEVAHRLENGQVEIAVVHRQPKTRHLRLEGAEAYGARIWIRGTEPFELSSRRATRTRTVDLSRREQLFVATGSQTILADHDPRPATRRSLWLARLALVLVIESAVLATVLLFFHPLESFWAKLGALLALAQFLGAPLLERAVRQSARDPDEPGARFVEVQT
jgi:hypothetical protein